MKKKKVADAEAKPRVSVVILAFNHEKYIRETLEGAVRQVTDFPFEIHIHDDASGDRTPDIIREYQARYPNLIRPVFQTENQFSKGVKIFTNFVYPNVTSDYIAYCEGDDYWVDPHKLQRQVDFLDAHPEYSICVHDVEMQYEEGVAKKETFYIKPQEGTFTFSYLDEFMNHFVATPTIMVRKEIAFSVPENRKGVSGDIHLALYFLTRGKGYYMADKMVVKRRNLGGITLNREYKKRVSLGTYYLWKNVLDFTPRPYRGLIRFKIAEYQRYFLKIRAEVPGISRVDLLVGAIFNNPFWLVGLSEWYRGLLLEKARRYEESAGVK